MPHFQFDLRALLVATTLAAIAITCLQSINVQARPLWCACCLEIAIAATGAMIGLFAGHPGRFTAVASSLGPFAGLVYLAIWGADC